MCFQGRENRAADGLKTRSGASGSGVTNTETRGQNPVIISQSINQSFYCHFIVLTKQQNKNEVTFLQDQ